MKKLKLKLQGKEMLSKEQMKKVTGGYDFTCDCNGCVVGYIGGDSPTCDMVCEWAYEYGVCE